VHSVIVSQAKGRALKARARAGSEGREASTRWRRGVSSLAEACAIRVEGRGRACAMAVRAQRYRGRSVGAVVLSREGVCEHGRGGRAEEGGRGRGRVLGHCRSKHEPKPNTEACPEILAGPAHSPQVASTGTRQCLCQGGGLLKEGPPIQRWQRQRTVQT
jgi:hypothetical protein